MPDRPYTLAEAVALGWRPKKVADRRVFDCQADCGRQIVTCRSDRVNSFLCPTCRASFTGYLRRHRPRNLPRKATGSPCEASPAGATRGPSKDGAAILTSGAGGCDEARRAAYASLDTKSDS